MDTFYSLNKLLSNFPFSILGYYQHEKEIDSFFEQLCESDFISRKNNIELVSYSYAKLDDLSNWGTKSLSSKFFFHALNEKYSLLALNAYYSLRNQLFERKEEEVKNSPHLSNNVAIVLSRLFLKDVGFRLCFKEGNEWHFSFLEQNKIFSIKLPLSRIFTRKSEDADLTHLGLFIRALGRFLSESISSIDSLEKMNGLIVQKVPNSKSSYVKIEESKSPIDNALNNIRQLFKSKSELEILRNEFVQAILFWHKSNPGFFTEVDTEKHVENWVELFFQIVFISLVYNAWVEYFPSVCGVYETKQNKEYRNLGGLILGYKIDSPLTQEERSIFKIISARISSTVAGQWMHEYNEQIKLESDRKNFKKLFSKFDAIFDSEEGDFPHGRSKVSEKIFNMWKAQAEENTEFIKPFAAIEKYYSSCLNIGEFTHQGLLYNVYLDKQKEKFLRDKNLFYKSIVKRGFSGFKYNFIDILFINEFIALLHENRGGHENGNTIFIECRHNGNKQTGINNIRFEINVEFTIVDTKGAFNMGEFYSKLKIAHTEPGSNLTKFILKNYELFKIHGDLEIKDDREESLFLLTRDTRLNKNERYVEVMRRDIPVDSYEKLIFIIHIQHNLAN